MLYSSYQILFPSLRQTNNPIRISLKSSIFIIVDSLALCLFALRHLFSNSLRCFLFHFLRETLPAKTTSLARFFSPRDEPVNIIVILKSQILDQSQVLIIICDHIGFRFLKNRFNSSIEFEFWL